jgi:hypothetical protein
MTSSKTTVLGIRLDHERRGWIEAEAARQGVSIRAYFERMIDEARSVEQQSEEPAEPIARESVHGVAPEVHDDSGEDTASEAWSAIEPDRVPAPRFVAPAVSSTEPAGLCDDLVSVFEISGRVLREAMGLPCALVDVAKRPFRRNHPR